MAEPRRRHLVAGGVWRKSYVCEALAKLKVPCNHGRLAYHQGTAAAPCRPRTKAGWRRGYGSDLVAPIPREVRLARDERACFVLYPSNKRESHTTHDFEYSGHTFYSITKHLPLVSSRDTPRIATRGLFFSADATLTISYSHCRHNPGMRSVRPELTSTDTTMSTPLFQSE